MKDKTVVIWDVKTGKLIRKLTRNKSDVFTVEFSPDGRLLGSGSWDNRAVLYNFQTEDVVCEIEHHKKSIRYLYFSLDSSIFASASWDKTVCLSKIDTGELLKRISHNNSVESVDFSPDGKIIVTGPNDDRTIQYGKVRIYDVKSSRVVRSFDHHIYCVAFHPGGGLIASGSEF